MLKDSSIYYQLLRPAIIYFGKSKVPISTRKSDR
jgi:hypothetical protein